MTLFDRPAPRWFTIPAHRPFVEDLAATLHTALAAGGPEALADAVVLTPTRRGARALAEAFVKAAGGRAVLLPQILALGDLDEGEPPFEPGDLALDLPPAITASRRRFELARIVADHPGLFDHAVDAPFALEMADALAALLDSLQIEEIDPADKLDTLVEGDFARHWKRSARVLDLAVKRWPERLAELGLVDVNQRRTALLRALAEQWRIAPPDRPLIAAGSTGTAPATAALLAVIAAAPQGAVVLPGLDQDLAADAWKDVGEDHPQGAMRRLLQKAGIDRDAVQDWPSDERLADAARGRLRRRVINEALRPADGTADWLRLIGAIRAEVDPGAPDPITEGLSGLSVAPARSEEEAAVAVALLLREALETPGRTAALVTPDAAMARRVSARLARWGIRVDSSAGQSLAAYPAGALMSLVAGVGADPMDPATLLAILKHSLVRLGADADAARPARAALERYGLRGGRPRDWAALTSRLKVRRDRPSPEGEPAPLNLVADLDAAVALTAALQAAVEVFRAVFQGGEADALAAARALAACVETLAQDGAGNIGDLWGGAGGEAAATFVSSLIEDSEALPPLTPRAFADLIDDLLARQLVRTGGANHPRLRILGAIEARLVRADRLVLAGLEEGVWPRLPPVEPFLSRPMRERLGLPPPERRIGLAAHDFAQAACAPEVILVTTDRRDGQPAVKSRWLWRLETLARGAFPEPKRETALPGRDNAIVWARALDAPLQSAPAPLLAARQPGPTPPTTVRPRRMPVTRIETWVRDPYAVYARMILGLRAMDRPDARLEASTRGSAIHKAFQLFAEAYGRSAAESEGEAFARLMVEALQGAGVGEAAMTRERLLAARLGDWAADFEHARRATGPRLLIEQEGAHSFEVLGGGFTVTAKADRIELADGLAHVLDFKTGGPPSAQQVVAGFSPQLTLTAAILARGGFGAANAGAPGELLYVRAAGRRVAGEIRSAVGKDLAAADLAEAAFAGLCARVERFDDPSTPYLARVAPQFIGRYGGDYDHLSRLYEWHVMGEADEGGEAG